MHTQPLIEVKNLGKKYRIRSSNRKTAEIWPLRDICFEAYPGDKIAILGENGSGKSTLFKLISEITDPTEGSIILRGKVSSILEVGVGFHHELSARENIFLYGAFMGMNKKEVKEKFDLLVDFAEIEKFLETPLKKYSSGMQARLAFAVATHLKSEILLVDEILSICDAGFRKKALQRMEKLANEGSVVMIVSHDHSLTENLFDKQILLENGKMVESY